MIFHLNEDDKKRFRALVDAFNHNLDVADEINEKMSEGDPSLLKKATLLKNEEYANNPYFLAVTPLPKKMGSWELGYEEYAANEVFLADNVVSLDAPYYEEKNPLGYFAKPFRFLSLKEKGTTWMSVIPHEINTMKEPLSLMNGKVVVMGLGLGYFAFQCLNKETVTKVTVVERDHRLISLFKESLLPYFPHQEKLVILEGDAFGKEAQAAVKDADSVFYDLWHNEDDGLALYEKALKEEKQSEGVLHSYWMEKGLLAYYRRTVIVIMDEELNHPEDQLDDFTSLLGRTAKRLEKKSFASYKEIASFLADESLKDLLRDL
jgi:hypothetical protein